MSLAERQEVQHKQIHEIANAYDRLVNMFTRVAQGAMKSKDVVNNLLLRMGVDSKTGVKVESLSEQDATEGSTINSDKIN